VIDEHSQHCHGTKTLDLWNKVMPRGNHILT
jgi:hypothetical protein